jgi:hypothetical protein
LRASISVREVGYGGAVDPTSFLRSWRRVKYLRIDAGTDGRPTVLAANAPSAGAVLRRFSLDPALSC